MSVPLNNWVYRQDQWGQPWHIFDAATSTSDPRTLCGILSASSLTSNLSPTAPAPPENVCDRCEQELSNRH